MTLRKCTLIRLGARIGLYSSARVSRDPREVGYWTPSPPFVTLDVGAAGNLEVKALRDALAASVDDPPLARAPNVKAAFGKFVIALGATSIAALMRDATLGDVVERDATLHFLVMRRIRNGFAVEPEKNFELPANEDETSIARAIERLLV